MRPSVASVAGRDIDRLCLRCRLRVRRASSSLAASSPLSATAARNVTTTAASTWSLPPQPSRAVVAFRSVAASSSPPGSLLQARSASSSSSSAATGEQPQPQPQQQQQQQSTHYDLFPETLPSGPPPAGPFPIDARALRREFLRLQSRTHPDLHPPRDKPRAEAASALVNDAYRTLASPLLRAQYLLRLRGVDVADDEGLRVEEPDLLMLVLEAREEIEEAQGEEDLVAPRRENDERIRESEGRLEEAFRGDEVEKAKREAVRLRYWVNIKESLDNWEPGKPVVLQH